MAFWWYVATVWERCDGFERKWKLHLPKLWETFVRNLNSRLACNSWWRQQMETFSALLALRAGNHRSPVNSPHEGQWRGDLMFSLICARINSWVNNREAGDWKRHRAHYDVTVMCLLQGPRDTTINFGWTHIFENIYKTYHGIVIAGNNGIWKYGAIWRKIQG